MQLLLWRSTADFDSEKRPAMSRKDVPSASDASMEARSACLQIEQVMDMASPPAHVFTVNSSGYTLSCTYTDKLLYFS